MPRRRPKRGRPKKFKVGDLAYSKKYGWTVIVDWRVYGIAESYYRIVRLLHPLNGASYGEAVWVRSHKLRKPKSGELAYETATRRTIPGIYRANERLEERGCRCNCCAHTAIPKSQIMKDGSFKWERESEDED